MRATWSLRKVKHDALLSLVSPARMPCDDKQQTERYVHQNNNNNNMILPFAKLGTLAIRTLSKPLAARLKSQAARHERFRKLIENFAQAQHKFSVTLQRRIYGHATNVEIRPLDPEKAVQAVSELLGELVVFSVGVGAVIFEVQRSARSEARKEEARRQEIVEISARLQALEETFEKFVKGQGQASSTWLPFRQAQKPDKT